MSEHYTAFPRGEVTGIGRAMAKITFERAALVLPDSLDLGRSIRELGIRGRFAHIPNIVDTGAFRPRASTDRDRPGPVRMLNVASLDEKKGHRYLLEALAAARRERSDLTLDIVGDGPLARRARIAGRGARPLERGDLPRLPWEGDVAEAMTRADFFVLSSLFENAPHVLIEAMASGLPCVATRVGGVDEMIDSRRGRLVAAADSGELADAILDMSRRFRDFRPDELAAHARGGLRPRGGGEALDGDLRRGRWRDGRPARPNGRAAAPAGSRGPA